MENSKLHSELYSIEDFIAYYDGAAKRELKARLKSIGNTRDISKKNEKKAITALLSGHF